MRLRLLSGIQYILRNACFIIRVIGPPLTWFCRGILSRPSIAFKSSFKV